MKKNILAVDDDLQTLKNLELILSDDFEVSVAKSARQALGFLNKGVIPSLFLLDIAMPDMDGYELLEEIRKIRGCEGVPVIFLTGYHDTEHELRSFDEGVCDYITKPFVKEILVARIRRHIELNENYRRENLPGEIREKLTDTEYRVLLEIDRGLGNHEIAETLNYSYGYIKNTTSLIFAKLDVKNRKELRRMLHGEEK